MSRPGVSDISGARRIVSTACGGADPLLRKSSNITIEKVDCKSCCVQSFT